MGLTYAEAAALRGAILAGARFDRIATIGRQWLLTREQGLPELLAAGNVRPDLQADFLREPPQWADDLFRLLGAQEIVSIDASDYEGATVVHDLNSPLPEHLIEGFDFVFDGGTLEHVFNFPQAVRNEMELTRVGGHLLVSVPANNHLGHGFYQFSPELFFRVFSAENGFEVVEMTLTEMWSGRRYAAVDPAAIMRRAELNATAPCLVVSVLARRTARKPIFAGPPMQSDYAAMWSNVALRPKVNTSRARRWLIEACERWLPAVLQRVRRRRSMSLAYHPDLFPPRTDKP